MNKFNIGILGCGNIATKMAETLCKMDNICFYACAARDMNKARDFQEKFNIKHSYGSYNELVKDKNIDLIYIATPHSHHYEQALLCLENNKHILCEKPMMVNEKDTKKIFSLAKEKGLLVTEAMWTRYMPMTHKLKEIVESNVIGDITSIEANLFYPIENVERLYNPSLAGGVTLDLGVYPISFVKNLFKQEISNLKTECIKFDTGVDKHMYVYFGINNIDVKLGFGCANPKENGIIIGAKGRIEVNHITNFSKITVYDLNDNKTEYLRDYQITGFEYQVLECIEAINNNKLETKSMTHQDTLDIIKICDEIREQNNIKYPFE